ncbi:RNA-binding domain-containing protein [Anabaena azotica]|uniref:RNA-binding domain-containing protein n=1 Tax=Anabaena azotica TaxID=197653 RepID=UPI0039A402ED
MIQETKFIQGQIFHREEGKYVEFKSIESQKPVKKIVDYAEQYIIGFLNASVEGDIYLGIDDSGTILGIALNRSQKDEIQKNITDKLRNIDPVISPTYYDIEIHDIYDMEEQKIENIYVVQLHTLRVEEDDLYRTSEREYWMYKTAEDSVYMKKASSCFKLSGEEINKESKMRYQKHLRKDLEKIDNKLLRDPKNILLLKEKAKIAEYMSDVQMVRETYEKMLTIIPNNPKIRIAYASAQEKFGDSESALAIINDGVKLDNNNQHYLKKLGEILFSSDRQSDAINAFKAALDINPDDYTILTQIGITLRELGNYKESLYFLNSALSKAPNYRAAKYEKKKTYSKMFQGGTGINKTY